MADDPNDQQNALGNAGIGIGAAIAATNNQTGGAKEHIESRPGSGGEKVGERKVDMVEEVPTSPEIEKKPELAGYVEKVEKATEAITPITDDYTGQVLLKSTTPQNVTVTLPLTEDEVAVGLHQQVFDSLRWLAEWCVRQVHVLHGRVRYKSNDSKE